MKKVHVRYEGGQSRYSDRGVDYMLAVVGGVELYAEANPRDYCGAAGLTVEELDALYEAGGEAPEAINSATYADLKAAILGQAAEHGIPAIKLEFDD